MRLKNYKKNISILIIIMFCALLSINTVFAQSSNLDLLKKVGETGAGYSAATDDTTVSQIIGSIIKYLLSFLGVLFICLIIYGGFLWMTARGDNEQITKAKDIIKSSVIGLVIVISAYTLVYNLFYFLFSDKGIV